MGSIAESEAKMLRAATRLGALRDVTVVRTFLGAHALPPEAGGDKDRYIDQVCNEQLPPSRRQGSPTRSTASARRSRFSPDADGARLRCRAEASACR